MMRTLDLAAIVAQLAVSTKRAHILVRCSPEAARTIADTFPATLLPVDAAAALLSVGWTVVDCGDFVSGALDFCNMQDRIVGSRIHGTSLMLAQTDGSIRRQEATAETIEMPARIAA